RADIGGVLHVKAPYTATQWVQALGRAGRDGQRAEAIVLLQQSSFTSWREPPGVIYDDAAAMDTVALRTFLKDDHVCRRQSISAFMDGEVWACGELGADAGCDVCDPDRLCVASGGEAVVSSGKGKGRIDTVETSKGKGRQQDTSLDADLAWALQQEEDDVALADLGMPSAAAAAAAAAENVDADAIARDHGLDADFFDDDLSSISDGRRTGGSSSRSAPPPEVRAPAQTEAGRRGVASGDDPQSTQTAKGPKKRTHSQSSLADGGSSSEGPELVRRIRNVKKVSRQTTQVSLSRQDSVHRSSSGGGGGGGVDPVIQAMMLPPPTPPLSSSTSQMPWQFTTASSSSPSARPSSSSLSSPLASYSRPRSSLMSTSLSSLSSLPSSSPPSSLGGSQGPATGTGAGALVPRTASTVQSRSTSARHGPLKERAIRMVQAAYRELSGHCPICFVLRLPDDEHILAGCKMRRIFPGYVKAKFSPYAACYLSYAPQLICGCRVIGGDSRLECQITNNTWIQRALFVLASDPAAFQNAVEVARSGFGGLPPYSVEISFPAEAGVPPPEWFSCVRWLDIQVYPAFVLIVALLLQP
ncbi:hypothetical protein A4X13_0g5819, partial [Tilletia indica]